VKAEKDGCDTIVIDCACDPVLDAAREVCQVPVVAPRNSALHVALTLGMKFSIITVQGQWFLRCMEEGVRKEGLESFCASFRHLTMPVLDIPKNPKDTQKELLRMSKKCIEEAGANVIVLGCTALSH
jgi:allantoin racemase